MSGFFVSFLAKIWVITFETLTPKPHNQRTMEKSYEQRVNDWLNTDPSERNLEVGATLMLQGNRNRILRDNVLRKQNFEKVEYELTKIIGSARVIEEKFDLQKLDLSVAISMKSLEEANEKGELKGFRPDHESLPENIRQIPVKNLERYRTMRSLFEKIKLLSEDGHAPEERVPFLKELFKHEESLIADWATYDKFVVGKTGPAKESKPVDAKRIMANRKYLSENKKKYPVLIESGKPENAAKLLAEMQKRCDELTNAEQTFDPGQLVELRAIGLIISQDEKMIGTPGYSEQMNNDLPPAVGSGTATDENSTGDNTGSGNQ